MLKSIILPTALLLISFPNTVPLRTEMRQFSEAIVSQNPAGNLTFKVPEQWTTEQSSSRMRLGQYRLGKVEGDTEDASLVLYYFGETQGGTAAANIERWIGQIQQPDGSSSKDKAKETTQRINGLKVTSVDLSGTYVAETAPGSGEFLNKPNYRLRAAVIETPKGPYFVKLVGPQKTVAHWDAAFTSYVQSFEFR